MPFTIEERQSLLALKGVGPTVLSRLESLGYGSFAQLRQANALDIVAKASALTGSSCWKNSPQARGHPGEHRCGQAASGARERSHSRNRPSALGRHEYPHGASSPAATRCASKRL
jgi:hypothetical protein